MDRIDALGHSWPRWLRMRIITTTSVRTAFLWLFALVIVGCANSTERKRDMSEQNVGSYRLALIKIPVSDIQRSAAFYRQTLGFEQEFVAAEYGWAQFKAGELPLALYKPGMG